MLGMCAYVRDVCVCQRCVRRLGMCAYVRDVCVC